MTDHSPAIRHCYTRWFEAVMAADASPFTELLADDFSYVDIFGAVRNAATYQALVADIQSGMAVMTLGDVEAMDVGALVRAVGD